MPMEFNLILSSRGQTILMIFNIRQRSVVFCTIQNRCIGTANVWYIIWHNPSSLLSSKYLGSNHKFENYK